MIINNTEVSISSLVKVLPIIMTLIALIVGSFVYISTINAEQKDWVLDQDIIIKQQIRESFTTKEEFAIIKTNQENIGEKLEEIKIQLEKLNDKIIFNQKKDK